LAIGRCDGVVWQWEVGKLFRRLSDYSRLHLADAQARSGFREIPAIETGDFIWPGLESPETAAIWAADPLIGREQALEIALDAETAGFEYYKNILEATDDPEIKALAKEFVAEESGHVAELQKWIAAHKAGHLCRSITESMSTVVVRLRRRVTSSDWSGAGSRRCKD